MSIALREPLHLPVATVTERLFAIDALRGLVMLLMLVDHSREFFFLNAQVTDPMTLSETSPGLFFTRLLAHLCAPVFIGLTGLSAFLYGESKARKEGADPVRAASLFLLKRGLFLIVLEWTVINFAWTFDLTPKIVFLQVIWAIGLSMLVLAVAIHLPRFWLILLGAGIIAGHNLLDPVTIAPGQPAYVLWTILHDRGMIDLPFGGQARTSYPVLPWFGVIMLGYAIGPWFRRGVDGDWRRRMVMKMGLVMIGLFIIARGINVYGDAPWAYGETPLLTVMSFLNITKYPPSMDFLLLTLGVGLVLLVWLEKAPAWLSGWLAIFGGAPLFFYIVHLYGLHLLNLLAVVLFSGGSDGLYNVEYLWQIWLIAAVLAGPLWLLCLHFGRFKRTRRYWWLAYL